MMKPRLYILLLAVLLWGCGKEEKSRTFTARILNTNEEFNQYQKENTGVLKIHQLNDSVSGNNTGQKELFSVKFNDTTLRIQTDMADKNLVSDRFAFAQFMNTQQTCLLVQLPGSPGFVAPFYLIALKHGRPDVVSLFRPSTGKQDRRFTKGLEPVGRSGYLVNNDFFITTVDARVYMIRRQNPEERIQGIHFINSSDRKTLVFLVSSSLYEIHYPTGETFTQQLSKVPENPHDVYKWVQDNYSWQKNARDISFLKKNDDDKIIDISEFK
jgi:hypothetical protein